MVQWVAVIHLYYGVALCCGQQQQVRCNADLDGLSHNLLSFTTSIHLCIVEAASQSCLSNTRVPTIEVKEASNRQEPEEASQVDPCISANGHQFLGLNRTW